MTNGNDLAFQKASLKTEYISISPVPRYSITHFGGLTKREYFAALAMQGYISGTSGVEALSAIHSSNYCRDAVACADALITELNKETP